MGKVLIIGAGGVATVAAHKVCQNTDVFTEIMIASRTKSKCDALAEVLNKKYGTNVTTAQVDADSVEELVALFSSYKPEIVMNLALPYQDLTIMEACLQTGCNYLDTANYEPKDEAHFEYSWQWAYRERFEQAGLCAILGCGFDPGVTSIYTAYAAKHHFREMHYLDIVDCNAGNHHKAFATNFNPEINIREITQKGKYYENGEWIKNGTVVGSGSTGAHIYCTENEAKLYLIRNTHPDAANDEGKALGFFEYNLMNNGELQHTYNNTMAYKAFANVTERCLPPVHPILITRLFFPSLIYRGIKNSTISTSLFRKT